MNLILLLSFVVVLQSEKAEPEISKDLLADTCLEIYGDRNSAGKARILSEVIGVYQNETEYQLIMKAAFSNCSEELVVFIPEQCAPVKNGTCFCSVKVSEDLRVHVKSMICLAFHPYGDSAFPQPVDIQLPLTSELAEKACQLYNPDYKLLAIYEGTYGDVLNETIIYDFDVKALNSTPEYERKQIIHEQYRCNFQMELGVWDFKMSLIYQRCTFIGHEKKIFLIGEPIPLNIHDIEVVDYTVRVLDKYQAESGRKVVGFFVKKAETILFHYYNIWADIIFCSNTSLRYCDRKEKCYFSVLPNHKTQDVEFQSHCAFTLYDF